MVIDVYYVWMYVCLYVYIGFVLCMKDERKGTTQNTFAWIHFVAEICLHLTASFVHEYSLAVVNSKNAVGGSSSLL